MSEEGYGKGLYDWSTLAGTSSTDTGYAVARDSVGNLYAAVGSYNALGGTHVGFEDAVLIKYSAAGVQQWARQTGSTVNDTPVDVVFDSIGNPYIIGTVASDAAYDSQSNPGGSDVFITKYDPHGNKQWSKQLGSSGDDTARAAAVSSSDVIYITGETYGDWDGGGAPSSGDYDAFTLRVDTSGSQVGLEQARVANKSIRGMSIAFDSSGNYYQAGDAEAGANIDGVGTPTGAPGFVRKFNKNNSRQWTKLIDTSSGMDLIWGDIVVNSDDSRVYVVHSGRGTVNGQTSTNTSERWLIVNSLQASSPGAYAWTTVLPYHGNIIGGTNEPKPVIGVDSSNNIYVLSQTGLDTTPTGYDVNTDGNVQLTKLNSSGVEQWAKTTGGDFGFLVQDIPREMAVTEGGQLYITGRTYANGSDGFHGDSQAGSADSFLFKMDGTDDNVTMDSVSVVLTVAPSNTVTITPSGGSAEFIFAPSTLTFTTSDWNTAQTVYVFGGLQDNTTDVGTTETLTLTASSSDGDYNGMTKTVTVNITDQDPPYPLSQPNLTGAAGGIQQVSLSWNAVTRADYYRIFWKKDATNNYDGFDVNDNNTYDGVISVGNVTSYVHAGLSSGNPYHYTIVAGKVGYEHAETVRSNSRQATSVTDFTTETLGTDNDTDLVVYYDFDSGGSGYLANKSPNTGGAYNLTAVGSEIVVAGSRFTGNTAAYFDAAEGYAFANDVNDSNITELSNTGNFTISVWIYPDQDMSNFSSIMSTGDQAGKNAGAFQISQTSSSPNPNKIRMFAQNTDIKLEGPTILDNTWYHVVFTKTEQNGVDNGTGTFYGMECKRTMRRISRQAS